MIKVCRASAACLQQSALTGAAQDLNSHDATANATGNGGVFLCNVGGAQDST